MRKIAVVLVGAMAIAVAGAGWMLRPDLLGRVIAGHVSEVLCSGVLVSHLDPARVDAVELVPMDGSGLLHRLMRYDVDRTRGAVTTTLAGWLSAYAVYREGLGCTVVPQDRAAGLQPRAMVRQITAPLLAEIAGPTAVEPASEALRAALDDAFAEPDHPPYRQTKAVVVVHDGRVVAERYAPGYDVETPILGWSMTKSVTNALIGILVHDGRLAIDRPAPVPAWAAADDPRHAITIDQLLRMTSGLALGNSLFGGMSSACEPSTRMLYLEPDMAAFAESVPLEAAPGTKWSYADGNTLILSHIVRDAVGGTAESVIRFADRELFGPLGMRTAVLQLDAAGTPVGSSAMLASARDWARFGMLYLEDGVVGGRRILPPGWVGYSSSPTPDAWVGYGAGLWTNQGASPGAQLRIRGGMPAEAFFACGTLGQYAVVVPSHRLVVVRLGATHGPRGDMQGISRLLGEVVAALGPGKEQAARH